jgi:hypothetical protein
VHGTQHGMTRDATARAQVDGLDLGPSRSARLQDIAYTNTQLTFCNGGC